LDEEKELLRVKEDRDDSAGGGGKAATCGGGEATGRGDMEDGTMEEEFFIGRVEDSLGLVIGRVEIERATGSGLRFRELVRPKGTIWHQ